MKLKTRLKLKSFKRNMIKAWYKFWEVLVFKPISKPYLAIQDRKQAKRINGATYSPHKLKKLLYKTIQDILLVDRRFYIFDVDFITESDQSSDFIEMRDLFTKSTYKFLRDYWYDAKNPPISKDEIWDVVVGFNGDEMDIKYITKEEFQQDMSDWKYLKYRRIYKDARRIIRVQRKES